MMTQTYLRINKRYQVNANLGSFEICHDPAYPELACVFHELQCFLSLGLGKLIAVGALWPMGR